MSLSTWGLVLGTITGLAAVLIASRVAAMRRSDFAVRVLPYLADIPELGPPTIVGTPIRALVGRTAATLDDLLGGNSSVRRKIERAGLSMTVTDFRVEQLTWGVIAAGGTAAFAVLLVRDTDRIVPVLILCCVSFVLGLLLRDNRLSAQVRQREERILEEFPAVAEMLALSVAAGEGPVAAIERVCSRSHGALSGELGRVLAEIRAGATVADALDNLARRSGQPVVARFAAGLAVALERGTPLADVLHAQAGDVREARRRTLIESGARRGSR